MHILHVIESLEFGGAEKVVIHLANRLSEKQQITVCLVKNRGELINELSNEIDVICLDLGEGIHFCLPGMLAKIISEKSIDIVNIHNWGIFFEGYLATKKSKRAKLILTVHGPYTEYGSGLIAKFKKKLRHFVECQSAKSDYVAKIVTVSDSIQKYIIADIGILQDKLITIHNGISVTHYQPTKNDSVLKLITVGRLAAIKNHRMMFEALKICVEVNRDMHLTIVGDGPERQALEEYARDLQLSNYITFLGFRNDVQELVSGHDIFVMSSDYEGISIAILEAMSMAKPVVSTNVGGVPETIQHYKTGLISPKGDAPKFASAILELGGSSELQQVIGRNAKQFFLDNFHENIVLEKYTNLYNSCIE